MTRPCLRTRSFSQKIQFFENKLTFCEHAGYQNVYCFPTRFQGYYWRENVTSSTPSSTCLQVEPIKFFLLCFSVIQNGGRSTLVLLGIFPYTTFINGRRSGGMVTINIKARPRRPHYLNMVVATVNYVNVSTSSTYA